MRKLLSEMISDLEKCLCTFTFMHFMVRALPEVQNHYRKQCSHKVLYNSIFNFFGERFGQNLKSKKRDFPLYFQKWIGPM